MVDVSLVLVSWNTRKLLEECLLSVNENTRRVRFEIVVVDNASTDGSAAMVRRRFPGVTLIQNHSNLGFAAACNQGILVSRGRYVLLLNTDTILLNDAVGYSVEYADANPTCAVVGCRVRNIDLSVQESTFMYPSLLNLFLEAFYLAKLFPRSRFFGRSRMTWWDREDVHRVEVVTGCFMLIRKRVTREVGLLDERYFMYGEETDFCYRVRRSGLAVMYVPVGEIIHLGGGSSELVRSDMALQLRSSILLFFRNHRRAVFYLAACGLTAAFFFFRSVYWLLTGLLLAHPAHLGTSLTCAHGFVKALRGWKGLAARPDRPVSLPE